MAALPTADTASVDLLWIPLGAGQHIVRISGRLFEAAAALIGRRARCDLFHSALDLRLRGQQFVIEMAPVPDAHGALRGVVAEGAVGTRLAGRLRVFRYEVRCWPDGLIPDAQLPGVTSQRVSDDPTLAERILERLPDVPRPVWGRDELRTGDMWNSNSVTSWVLARAGVDLDEFHPPGGGRAPGWSAGVVEATRAGEL